MELVSVCIPTYNGSQFLKESLESVKNQTYQNIEVIVSDNFSTDNTMEIVNQFKKEVDFPIKIFLKKRKSIGSNWNNCIKKSSGDYIQFLFQDDILLPNCIEEKLKCIKKNNLKIVCSKREIIDDKGSKVNSGPWYDSCHDLQKLNLGLDIDNYYLLTKNDLKNINFDWCSTNIFGEPISFLYKKEIFEELGLFNVDYAQLLDLEFGYRVLKKYPIGIIGKKLFKFRLHQNQATNVNLKDKIESRREENKIKEILTNDFLRYMSFEFQKKYYFEKYPRIHKKLIRIKYFKLWL